MVTQKERRTWGRGQRPRDRDREGPRPRDKQKWTEIQRGFRDKTQGRERWERGREGQSDIGIEPQK